MAFFSENDTGVPDASKARIGQRPCSASDKRLKEAVPCGNSESGWAAEICTDRGNRQATAKERSQAPGSDAIGASNSEQSLHMSHGHPTELRHKFFTQSPHEEQNVEHVGASPGEEDITDGMGGWRPYKRKADIVSMDLDAICMPPG